LERVYLSQLTGAKPPGGRIVGRIIRATGCAFSLLLFLGSQAPVEAAAEGIYRYVDKRGVVHFTNVNPDKRYRRVTKPRGLTRASSGSSSSRLSKVRRYDPAIARHSEAVGIPPALVKAVIHAESAFNPKAVSRKGAMGLMQLMPGTADMLGVNQPFRADDNIEGGTRYLRNLHDRYGSWTHTLAAYNAGPTAVDKYRGVPPYDETREYVRRVLSFYRRYHADFPR